MEISTLGGMSRMAVERKQSCGSKWRQVRNKWLTIWYGANGVSEVAAESMVSLIHHGIDFLLLPLVMEKIAEGADDIGFGGIDAGSKTTD